LRGFEGMAAKAWFAFVRAYIPPPFEFPGRQMRPPNDPINSLLSLGYTWVNTRVSAGIQAVGLDLGHAAYHAPRSGRPSLACDLMEPLRVPLVDRWVLLLCRRKSVQPDHFHTTSKGVRLVRSRFPLVLQSFERHFHEQQGSKLLRSGVAWFRDQVRAQTKNAGPEAASGETKACRS
jgi:CRISPR-associated protein Cas1